MECIPLRGLPLYACSENITVFTGVNSFHAFMSNEGLSMLKDSDLYRLFCRCRQLNALPLVHAENGALIEEVG